jgi:hypothetical protein
MDRFSKRGEGCKFRIASGVLEKAITTFHVVMWHDLWQIWENFHVSLIVAASVDPGQCSKIF